jgi:hypothetical protein
MSLPKERESYAGKNNTCDQVDFINSILPLYGIESVCDTKSTAVVTDEALVKLTSEIPQIKKLFKVSVMNLGRSNNQITHTNCIPILKHMCIQAKIPFEVDKTSKGYTFSLAPENLYLSTLRLNIKSKEPRKFKPLSYFESFPVTELEPHLISCFPLTCKMALTNSNLIKQHVVDSVRLSHASPMHKLFETKSQAVKYLAIKCGSIEYTMEYPGDHGSTTVCYIPCKGIEDTFVVKSLLLYDKDGNEVPYESFHTTTNFLYKNTDVKHQLHPMYQNHLFVVLDPKQPIARYYRLITDSTLYNTSDYSVEAFPPHIDKPLHFPPVKLTFYSNSSIPRLFAQSHDTIGMVNVKGDGTNVKLKVGDCIIGLNAEVPIPCYNDVQVLCDRFPAVVECEFYLLTMTPKELRDKRWKINGFDHYVQGGILRRCERLDEDHVPVTLEEILCKRLDKGT